MQSKLLLVSILLAIAPAALAAPYQQPVTTTTPCAKPTTTTKCTSSTTTSKCTSSTTTSKCTSSTTPSVAPYVVPSSSEPAPYVLPTTTEAPYVLPTVTPEPYYVETTTSDFQPITITHRITETQSAAPAPTVTVLPPPPPPPPKVLHCQQQWFGTAPFCNGKCPGGWNVVKYQKEKAKTCENTTPEKVVFRCDETSNNGCWTGKKALCEICEWK